MYTSIHIDLRAAAGGRPGREVHHAVPPPREEGVPAAAAAGGGVAINVGVGVPAGRGDELLPQVNGERGERGVDR
jgi:hypothetical protein